MTIHEEIVSLAAGFSGTAGLWARSLDSGETVAFQAADEFPSASVIKVPVLAELFRQAAAGLVNLDAPIALRPEDVVPGDGILRDLAPPVSLSVRNLAVLMTVISDNTASNLLIDLVGKENVNAMTAGLGLPALRLENKFYRGLPGSPVNRGTPAAFGRLMELIAQRQIGSPAACDEMLGILQRQHIKDQLTRFLDESDLDEAVIASKAGDIRGVRNELGYVRARGRSFVICMMSKGCADLRYHPDNEGSLLLAHLARVVYQYFIKR